jgi:acyl-CoA reductase-like NAD-dependent aldehyde dehydrogenase
VKVITFTGSSGVGWKLAERSPRKRVNLELGNSTPLIVEADADLDAAVAATAQHSFSFAGQSCISIQRVYVQEGVYEEFVSPWYRRSRPQARRPRRRETDVGPVIDEDARERILEVDEARSGGAEISPAAMETTRPSRR